jgi:hypothetical protein
MISGAEFSVENDAILLYLPSHSTPYLQLLGHCFFKPLKIAYWTCQTWILGYEKLRVSHLQFRKLLRDAWSHATCTSTAATVICFLDISNSWSCLCVVRMYFVRRSFRGVWTTICKSPSICAYMFKQCWAVLMESNSPDSRSQQGPSASIAHDRAYRNNRKQAAVLPGQISLGTGEEMHLLATKNERRQTVP